MPRKGLKYNNWSEENMKEAIRKYKTGNFGLNNICQRYNIPKPTFKRHLSGSNRKAKYGNKSLGRLTVFTKELEGQLETQILKLEECFHGLTIADIRKAAFDLVEKNNIPHNFSKEKQQAGKAWYYSFMKRHPNLSLRQPESTSLARCKGFNRNNVGHFFDILEEVINQNELDATRIYNVDETGFSTVQKRSQKIVAKRGNKQIGTVASGERRANTTMVVCASDSGHYVAPMIIFKRKRNMAELAEGAPPGCLVEVSDTGYINSDLFVLWLRSFIEAVRPAQHKKVLLVLDGHTTHSKNLEAINLARDNGVILLQLPGHTTHRLQPLDEAVFKPLEVYYNQAVEKWMREHTGLAVTQYQVSQLLGEAYGKAASVGFAMNGFRKCGIWPINKEVFTDVDFAASDALMDKENQPEEVGEQENEQAQDVETSEEDVPLDKLVAKRSQTPPLNVSIKDIIPTPNETSNNRPKSKTAQKAAVLTTTPYKADLENKKTSLELKAKSAVKRKIGTANIDIKKTCKRNKNASHTTSSSIIIEQNVEDWHCHLCNECFIEDMIQCRKCLNWIHESCAATTEDEFYVCDRCS